MKRYSAFPKAPKLEPHHQMYFNVIHSALVLFDPKMGLTGRSTTPGQKGLMDNGNKGVLHITQNSRTRALPSGAVSVHMQGIRLRRSYQSAEMK